MNNLHNAILSIMSFTSKSDALTLKQIAERLAARGLTPARTTIWRFLIAEGFESYGRYPVRYFIDEEVRNKVSISFTPKEIHSLALILKSQQASSTTYLSGAATDILTKLLKTFSDENDNLLKKSIEQFHFTSGIEGVPNSPDNELFKNIMQALKDKTVFECTYHSPYKKSIKKRYFLPLRLIYVSRTPYVYCKDLDDGEFKTLKVIRIKDFKFSQKDHSAVIDQNEINKAINNGFGAFIGHQDATEVKIEIKKESKFETYLMENMIHHSQEVKRKKASAQLELFCPVSAELERLLKGFREDIIKIKKPKYIEHTVMGTFLK